jgi:lauroyl/myristoyl acyltransferase
MIGRLIRSACVLYVYYPHLALLRLLGPRAAIVLSRAVAWVHWGLTVLGAERRTRRAIARARPAFTTTLPMAAILRRHLELKHQHFAEWYLYPTARGRRYVAETYRAVDGLEHLERARAGGRGVVVLMLHYGMARLVFPALKALGHDSYQHFFRAATYAGSTFGWVAKAAMNELVRLEESSGLNLIYHRPGLTFTVLARHLKRGDILAVAADGMTGTEFVDVPFLDGVMRFPTGPARLAAVSRAPIVPVFALLEGLNRHRLCIHPPIDCPTNSMVAAEGTVRAYAGILDSYIRQYPWAWWTWRRLDVVQQDGQVRFDAAALPHEKGLYHVQQTDRPAHAGTSSKLSRAGARG